MCARECPELRFLYLEERLVFPVKILLRSEVGLILLQQAINPAGRACTSIIEALNQYAERICSQHAGSIGEGHDVSAQFGNGVVQNRHLPAVVLIVKQANSSASDYACFVAFTKSPDNLRRAVPRAI